MTTEPSISIQSLEQSIPLQGSLDRIIGFFKDKWLSVLIWLFSGSVVAFVTSRLFIKSYLSEIGFDSLTYSALNNSQSVPTITLGIFSVILIFILNFSLVPASLRFIYQNIINLMQLQQINEKYSTDISIYFAFCLSLPILYLAKYYFDIEISSKFFLYTPFLNLIPFLIFIFEKRQVLAFRKLISIFASGIIFCFIVLLSIFPFFTILDFSNYSSQIHLTKILKVDLFLSQFVFIFIWLGFIYFTGLRITQGEKFHYLIDILIGVFLLFMSCFMSINALKVSIAEFTGIKDKEEKIYKITESDYKKIENDIKSLWQAKSSSKKCSKQSKENCYLIFAINKFDRNIYINAKVFFRDEKNTILCPPNVHFIGKKFESCFLVNTENLIPTSQTYQSIENNQSFKTYYFILK